MIASDTKNRIAPEFNFCLTVRGDRVLPRAREPLGRDNLFPRERESRIHGGIRADFVMARVSGSSESCCWIVRRGKSWTARLACVAGGSEVERVGI